MYGMPESEKVFTPREAAQMVGVSYPAIKQWILSGKLETVKTPGGHHRVTHAALQPFLAAEKAGAGAASRERYRRVSGRNQLAGKVVSVRVEGLMAEVVVATRETLITAIITAAAVRELQLKKGDEVAALIKSTDVMVERI